PGPVHRSGAATAGHSPARRASAEQRGRGRRAGQAQARDGFVTPLEPPHYRCHRAAVRLPTAACVPSNRTFAALRRPTTHRVSSAGEPMTVTIGVAFLAMIRKM